MVRSALLPWIGANVRTVGLSEWQYSGHWAAQPSMSALGVLVTYAVATRAGRRRPHPRQLASAGGAGRGCTPRTARQCPGGAGLYRGELAPFRSVNAFRLTRALAYNLGPLKTIPLYFVLLLVGVPIITGRQQLTE